MSRRRGLLLTRPGSRERWRLAWRLLIVIFVLAVLIGIGVVVFLVIGSSRASRAVAAIRARGEPLHADEIPFAKNAPPSDLDERLTRFKPTYDDSVELEIGDDDLDDVIAQVRAWKPAASALPTVEAFVSCAREAARTSEERQRFGRAIWRELEDPVKAKKLTECELLGVHARQLLREPMVELAEYACNAPPDSGERWVRARQPDDLMPKLPIPYVIGAVRALAETAPALAIDGRAKDAVHRLEVALHGSQTIHGWPWVLTHLTWVLTTNEALAGLQHSLPFLPREADLSNFERELDTIDSRMNCERALVGERALGNDILDHFAEGIAEGAGWKQTHKVHVSEIGLRLWLSFDHAFYLETMTAEIARARSPFPDWFAFEQVSTRDRQPIPSWALVSSMLLPDVHGMLERTAQLEASIHLAKAAIAALRNGSGAGARSAASAIDPFDGQPLRSRVESGGTLVIWSIGKNLVDDHAPPIDLDVDASDELDIVWRVKPR